MIEVVAPGFTGLFASVSKFEIAESVPAKDAKRLRSIVPKRQRDRLIPKGRELEITSDE